MPFLRNWKSEKLYHLSKVYLDQSITSESNLLKDGIRKARIAWLLAPDDTTKKDNFLILLYRLEPTQAILMWSDSTRDTPEFKDKKLELVKKCLNTLSDTKLTKSERIIAGKIGLKHLNYLESFNDWFKNPDSALLSSKMLAQLGNPLEAKYTILKSLDNHPTHVESIFFLTRIIVHLKDEEQLPAVGRKLAQLSLRRNKTGKEAIRHMTLLHLLQPLSHSSLDKCIDLLRSNNQSEPIDFMRIYALQYSLSVSAETKKSIVEKCSAFFNLEDDKENLTFCNWLGSVGADAEIIQFLSPSKAKQNEELFQLRMNALAKLNDLESIHLEVNNSPLIPLRWRLAIEARAYALQGNYLEAQKILNRLLASIESDPRHVRLVCDYLENSNDIKGLTYILNKLTDHPIHQTFALQKLIQHCSASSPLEELLGWMTKLSKTRFNDQTFKQTILYFELLDPLLPSPSKKLERLLHDAQSHHENKVSYQNKITLALAYLRNQEPDKAFVAIGPVREWRKWQETRSAWTLIASEIFKLNNDSEKSLILRKNIDLESISRAERDSFKILFSES